MFPIERPLFPHGIFLTKINKLVKKALMQLKAEHVVTACLNNEAKIIKYEQII